MVTRRLEQAMPNVYSDDRWVVIIAMAVDRVDYGLLTKDDIKLKMSHNTGQISLKRVTFDFQPLIRLIFCDSDGCDLIDACR